MIKKLQQKLKTPVGEGWLSGFVCGLLFIGMIYLELAYALPWIYEL